MPLHLRNIWNPLYILSMVASCIFLACLTKFMHLSAIDCLPNFAVGPSYASATDCLNLALGTLPAYPGYRMQIHTDGSTVWQMNEEGSGVGFTENVSGKL